jgi:cell division protein FtsL
MLYLIILLVISLIIVNIISFYITQQSIRKDLKAMEENIKNKQGVHYCGQNIKKAIRQSTSGHESNTSDR